MKKKRGETGDLSWLSVIAERGPALDDTHPISVRHVELHSDAPVSPPHRHAYCEFELLARGEIVQHVEQEQVHRKPGSFFFAGPGVPHWSTVVVYPVEYYVIYFKPWVLMGNGTGLDAWQIIRRCTARQALDERLIQPPDDLTRHIAQSMRDMLTEFEDEAFGRELKLAAFLNNILVDIWRWEFQNGRTSNSPRPEVNWRELELALTYIHTCYREQIYARDVAAAAHISESGLEELFREAIGMPWVRYLQRYRVQQAAALLIEDKCNVSEAALTVGFNSPSHFNTAFRSVMGLSPSQYLKQARTR